MIHSLRELGEANLVAVQLAGQTLVTYQKILAHYRPAELENSRRKYVEEWQHVIQTQKVVNYEYTERSLG